MPRHLAFLRGINVGGHRVEMARLRELFEELGFSDVATFIASGNVVFHHSGHDARALEQRIEGHLGDRLGYEVATVIRSPAELEAIVNFPIPPPWDEPPGETALYVILLQSAADSDLEARLAAMDSHTDAFHAAGREVYWSIRTKLSESPVFRTGIGRVVGDNPSTMRNMNTLRRLLARHGKAE